MKEMTKMLQSAKTFLKHKEDDLKRILSEDGIRFRANWSIQAEGPLGI